MALSRRDFLKLCAGGAASISMSGFLAPFLKEAAAAGNPPVIWLAGAACTGCSVSLLNTVHPDIKEVLLNVISLRYHSTVMGGAGDLAMEAMKKTAEENNGDFFLVVEGAVPLKDGGIYCTVGETHDGQPITFANLVQEIGQKAYAVLNVGTCSAYGGVPAAAPNPTGCVPVSEVLQGKPIINIPGCPAHPDWIVGTIAHVLLYKSLPELDKFGRPTMFYGGIVHDNCPRRQYFDNGIFAQNFSDPGCLLEIGCRGPYAHCDATYRQWNHGMNSCIRCGGPCIGCTEPGFPDGPVYERLPEFSFGPQTKVSADTVGIALGALTVAGIGGHLIGNVASGRIPGKHEEKEGDN
ncbi:MAG: hydrogenase small subunit [Syntrophomonadaceae bacterium]|nr:hydrogenase small subunit [Syntrophomonadaceae bacterium]